MKILPQGRYLQTLYAGGRGFPPEKIGPLQCIDVLDKSRVFPGALTFSQFIIPHDTGKIQYSF